MSKKWLGWKSTLSFLVLIVIATAAPLAATLTLEGEVNPDPIEPGELFDFQITVSSTSTTGNLTLRVLWPAALDFQSPQTTGGGSCSGACDAGEFLSWNLGSLGPNGTITVSFNDRVDPLADGTVIPFEIDLLEAGSVEVEKTFDIEVQATSPLELAIDPLSDPVPSGGRLIYELVYGNVGAGASSSTELRFPVPAGSQFVAATGGGMVSGGDVVWNLGTLPAGGSGRQRVSVDVNALSGGSLLVVDSASISGQVSFQTRSAQAMAVVRVDSESLLLEAELEADPLQVGGLIDGQILVSNPSASVTGSLTLRLLWPYPLDFESPYTSAGGSCSGSCDAGEYLVWNLGPLGPRSSRLLIVDEDLDSGADGTLIPFELELLEDGRPARNTSRTLIIDDDADLRLAVDPRSDPAPASEALVYELVWGNEGSSASTATELRFPLPDGTSFVSATGGGTLGNDPVDGAVVTWNLGTLAPNSGGRERVEVVVSALAETTPLVVDAAELSGTVSFLPQTARTATVSRVGEAALDLFPEVQVDPVASGELIDAQISVANPGASATGTLTLRMIWPEALDFESPYTTGGGSCSGSCDQGELLTWNLGVLGPGAALTVGFNQVIDPFTSGTVIPFEIELLEAGLIESTVSRSILGLGDSPLELTIDPSTDPVAPGADLTYVLTYGNTGASAIANAELRFPLPPGTVLLNSNGGSLAGNVVTFPLGTLAPNSGGRLEVDVRVAGLSEPEFLEVDLAEISGTVGGLPRRTRASAVVRVATEPLLLAVDLGPDPVEAGDLITGELTVTNPTGSATGLLTLRILWPDELDFESPDTTGGGSCSGSCDAGEYLIWSLGTLGPGADVQVTFSETLDSLTDGRLVPWEIELLDAGFPVRNFSQTLLGQPFSDSDMDGIADAIDPDDDNDGMPDFWESFHGLNPNNAGDAGQDPDGDGLSNLQEFQQGRDPNVFDLFFDGFETGNTSSWSSTVG